tara:strand:+ start:361 stop:582 length:222 start_codon:yes stop_codon:yes gene_type:complete
MAALAPTVIELSSNALLINAATKLTLWEFIKYYWITILPIVGPSIRVWQLITILRVVYNNINNNNRRADKSGR